MNKISEKDLKLLIIERAEHRSDLFRLDVIEVHICDGNNNHILSKYNLTKTNNNLIQWELVEETTTD